MAKLTTRKTQRLYRLRPVSLLTLKEVSMLCGLSVNALKKHILKGNIRGENLEGKVWLVKRKDVDRFLTQHAGLLKGKLKRRYQATMPLPITRAPKRKAGTLF